MPIARLAALSVVPLALVGTTVTTASGISAAKPAAAKAAFGLDATTY